MIDQPLIGVYALLDASDKIIYIGRSVNIYNRLKGHHIKYFNWRYWPCKDKAETVILEKEKIIKHHPLLNITDNPDRIKKPLKINKIISLSQEMCIAIEELRKKENRSFTNMVVVIIKDYIMRQK